MQTLFKPLLTAIAMSACVAHAAESTDPLGPLPGEVATAKTAPVASSSAVPSKAATTQAPATTQVKAPATPEVTAATPVSASSFAAKPAPATPAPAPVMTPAADPQKQVITPASSPVSSNSVVPALERSFTRTSNATFLQMDRLRSENAVLAEMVRKKELQDKLNPPVALAVAPTTPAPNTLTTGYAGMSAGANIHPNMVLSIYGIEDDLTAVLSTTGAPLKVKGGSQVPGLGQVKAISREGVMVATKKSTVALEMAPISAYPGAR